MESEPQIPLGYYSEIVTLMDTNGVEHHFSADWSSADMQAFIRERPNWAIRIQEVLNPFDDERGGQDESGNWDTAPVHYPEMDYDLTPQPARIKLGDFTTEGWKNVRDYAIYDRIKNHVDDGDIVAMDPATGQHAILTNFAPPEATIADLDARDHFASEVRDLHPAQLDRIEKRLAEIERQLGIDGKR